MFGNSKREADLSDALFKSNEAVNRLEHELTELKHRQLARIAALTTSQQEVFSGWRSQLDRTKHERDQFKARVNSAEKSAEIAMSENSELRTANQEFYEEALKAQTEILELKADIAEQVRVNRQYATEVGEERKENEKLRAQFKFHLNTSYFTGERGTVFDVASVHPIQFTPERDNLEKALFEPTAEDHLKTIAKRDKTIKRLKAKVKKLLSDNKAMAAEVLHNRNSM